MVMRKILIIFNIVSLSIVAQNTPPVAQDQSFNTTKGTATDITLVATDADNDILSYVVGKDLTT